MTVAALSLLLVEDSPSDALLVTETLRSAPPGPDRYVIAHAERLSQALARDAQAFDVALLDLGLPDSEGIDTLTRFREAFPRVPVIVLTGLDDEALACRALSQGAQDYVVKSGLDATSLLRSVRYAIERARVEAKLRASEENYRLMFECSPYAKWVADRETLRFLAVNAAAVRQYGYTREEFLSMTILDVLPQEEREAGRELARRIGPATSHVPGVFLHLTKAGAGLLVEISSREFVFEGRPALLTAVKDVTAKMHAERERRKIEQRFRTLFASEVIGLTVSLLDGTILEANRAFLRMAGAAHEELDSGALRWDAAVGRELLESGVAPPVEKEIVSRDGRRVPVLVGVSLLHGKPDTLLSWVVDLTEKRRLEEELRQAQKMDAVGKLAGGIAHDFNNLLMVINGYADVLLGARGPFREDAREMLEEIARAGQRAGELTRQLLALSCRQVLQLSSVDPNAVVEELQEALSRLAGDGVHVRLDLARPLGTVRTDPGQLGKVVLDLTTNARDAMPEGGELTIATSEEVVDSSPGNGRPGAAPGRYAAITVADTGTGMDAETLGHLFEPFFTTKPRGKGTGLGLATAWGIVRQSGGYIFVESAPGRGSRFSVLLPLENGAQRREQRTAANP